MQVQHSSGYCSSLHCVPIAKDCPSLARALHGHMQPPCFAHADAWGMLRQKPVGSVSSSCP